MGFHICEWCNQETSSGDVTLVFEDGKSYEMPDMILHYIADHRWLPPEDFIDHVIHFRLVDCGRAQTKAIPEKVGYISKQNFDQVETLSFTIVSPLFFPTLWSMMRQATKSGHRVQTRGMVSNVERTETIHPVSNAGPKQSNVRPPGTEDS